MKPVAVDYETYYVKSKPTDPGYSVAKQGNWRYCNDERFDPYMLSVFDGSNSWVGNPKDFNWEAIRGNLLLAHNAGFDSAVTRRLVELGHAPAWLLEAKWQCTANMTSYIASERSLAGAVQVLEGRFLNKGIRAETSGKTWADMVRDGSAPEVAKYALSDTRECLGLWNKYSHLWSPFEQDLSSLTMKQCARGVAIDTERLGQYIAVLGEVIFNLERSLPWTGAGAKPTSPKAIAEECRKVGIPAPPFITKDEEGFIAWQATYGPQFTWVRAVTQWRSLGKLLSTLETIKDRLRPDGTIDFSLLYFGAHTGRWSGGGSGLNMQNLRKAPLYIKDGVCVEPPSGLGYADMDAWVATTDHQLDIRRLFVARPGKKFIICDLSQIEPRVLNWLAGNHPLLKLIANGYAYYEAYSKSAYPAGYKGWSGTPGKLKKEVGLDNYTLLKNEALGCGFQMGPDRYTEYAGVSVEEARETVTKFREANPLIVDLWDRLNDEFRKSVGDRFEMQLPSGRSLVYRDVLRVVRTKKNKETGKPEPRLVYTALVGDHREELYGGKLTENITQAVARDVFGSHMLALEENTGDVIFHAHDEAITEVDESVTCKDVERVMSTCPEWVEGLPVAAEAQESKHYLK